MNSQADKQLVEAFTLMWGAYPGPASLVHKSKTIIAVNKACLLGGRKPGMICAKWDSPERHVGCLANRTIKEQMPMHKEIRKNRQIFRVYWLTIQGFPDYYIHFTTEPATIEDCNMESY
jgi:hypothetical protein